YDVVDPFAVDPALGGEAALDALLDAAAREHVRVLLDLTVTHAHRDWAPFADVRARGPASRWFRWFHVHGWPFRDGEDPGYRHYQKGCWREPLVDLDHAEVADHIVERFAHWARRGAHGLRVDAAADVPVDLCRRIRAAVRDVDREAVVFGEVVPASAERWTDGALDAATDFGERTRALDWLAGRGAAADVAAAAARARAARGPAWTAIGFAGCHDLPRPATVLGGAAPARAALLHLLCRAAVPLLYYGDEVGLASAEPAREFEDSWPDRQPMPWDAGGRDPLTLDLARRALALRRSLPALRRGDEEYLPALGAGDGAQHADVLRLRRRCGDQLIELWLHRGGGRARVRLDRPADPLLVLGDVSMVAGVLELGPWAAVVVDRSEPAAPELRDLREANAALAAHAFAAGMVDSPAYPVRLYLTVTEACNLRCLHCITDAPARTRGGRARELRPWLLAALADAFAHADYIGFTHGGEALTSPMLGEALAAIGRVRAGRTGRAHIHLATNGMLLSGDAAQRLVDQGVTSLMISIDGARAATNDRIRAGGRLDRVLANLRQVVRLRDGGADLRVGLSMVVTRGNLAEVEPMAALAVDLGVDWLKLEETWPANGFARREQVDARDPALAAARAAAAARVAGRVVLVDHLEPPAACACAGDPAALAFRAADDFANRFTYRPCRAAWEQACVDPDGTVHAVDYAGPALGSLLERPLAALWNGDAARALRADALAAAPAARRHACISA
ncbi:MAG TPA: alpha-amylase family glycosyl hydrolase, partial [Kofleriaceae bacterium]|nr:alpha-amylase family glycosyl hydrolase [Kofleriaceae bacterium]